MRKVCTGTSYDIDYCREEKMGCYGCSHFKQGKEDCNEQKIGKCSKNKINKTN